ncbi:MAG TPA: hypothetical protein VGI87_13845 [Solirubrobacteraceae bacterium]
MSDTARSAASIDRELDGMRRIDAALLSFLLLSPDLPPVSRLKFHLRARIFGVHGAMKRLERRGYIEPGWKLDHERGAIFEPTDLGKRVGPVAAMAVEAEGFADDSRVELVWWMRKRLRT